MTLSHNFACTKEHPSLAPARYMRIYFKLVHCLVIIIFSDFRIFRFPFDLKTKKGTARGVGYWYFFSSGHNLVDLYLGRPNCRLYKILSHKTPKSTIQASKVGELGDTFGSVKGLYLCQKVCKNCIFHELTMEIQTIECCWLIQHIANSCL